MASIMRRFSQRSSSLRKRRDSNQDPDSPETQYARQNLNYLIADPSPTTAGPNPGSVAPPLREKALGGDYAVLPPTTGGGGGGVANEGRPISSATDGSFDFANRPVNQHNSVATAATNTPHHSRTTGTTTGVPTAATKTYSTGAAMNPSPQHHARTRPQSGVNGLSRTDQIVLQHFWEGKYLENSKRDLHYLKFPLFPQYPGHRDLLPYCEIYHLVKTSPGATIISLGSADGVYIGFELQTGSQLHIDLDDDWFNTSTPSITHNRVTFRSYSAVVNDPTSLPVFKAWPKPLTIEFLEEQYLNWCQDLMSICWDGCEIRNLAAANGNGNGDGSGHGHSTDARGSGMANTGIGANSRQSGGSMVDDGYVSEKTTGSGI